MLTDQWREFTRANIHDWTPTECPRRAYLDPFTADVFRAFDAYSKGQMQVAYPRAPAVLVEAVLYLSRELNRSESWQAEQWAKAAKKGDADD